MEQERTLLEEVSEGSYDAADRPFDFVDASKRTALLCATEPGLRERIGEALRGIGCQVILPASAREALKAMRFHTFDVVVADERFEAGHPEDNDVLRYLENLPMTTRRNIFVVLLSERYRTLDNMAAFHRSVNIVLHPKNIGDAATILRDALADNEVFYRVFRETMKKVGRA